jgi:hypothetical protein
MKVFTTTTGRAPIWPTTYGGEIEREKVTDECDSDQNHDENGGGNHL